MKILLNNNEMIMLIKKILYFIKKIDNIQTIKLNIYIYMHVA